MICDNITVNKQNHLCFAGFDTIEMAQKYGTPLYLMDEAKIRQHINEYKNAFKKYFPVGSAPEFASKSFSAKQIYRIMQDEGMNIDVVSVGEIYTAKSAGFDMSHCFFHGNNKTDYDIAFAIDNGVGYFVIDSFEEIEAVNLMAKNKGIVQKALLRITPGIDTHTHQKISTGNVDSKFGFAIATGMADEAVQAVLKCENISLCGFHCHIGSQIFESDPFILACDLMLDFIAHIKATQNYTADILNLGGGFGVKYTNDQPTLNLDEKIGEVAAAINQKCDELKIAVPKSLWNLAEALWLMRV